VEVRRLKQKEKGNERAGGELAGWKFKRYRTILLTDLITCLEPGVSDEIKAYLTKKS
jgi:hypothetical protein